jgi:V-ATPase subunit C
MLVSLPTSISPANDKEEALSALQSTVASDNVTVLPFKIPEFKIGTLDALVQQADDLAKLESSCEAVVAKVGDSLRSLLEGDEDKIAKQKTVNDSKFHGSWAAACIYTALETDLPSQSPQTNTFELSPGTRSNIVPTNHLPN